jgi:transcriptional regulator with XRE-family HTH domain
MQIRSRKGMTQRELSRRAGIAGSYLSRIENRRLEPRPKTLRKIATGLEVPLAELFGEQESPAQPERCAVTVSGECMLKLMRAARGKPPRPGGESYTPRDLRLLRQACYLIHTADKRLLDTLETVLGALLNSNRDRSGRFADALPRSSPPVPA